MAIKDKPVNSSKKMARVDSPVKPKSSTNSPIDKDAEQFLAIQSSYMDSYLNGTDVASNYLKYSQKYDKLQDAKTQAQKKAEADKRDVQEEFVRDPEAGGVGIQDNTSAVIDAMSRLDTQGEDVDLQFTESAMGPDSSLEDAKTESSKVKMQKMLQTWSADVGTGDTIIEIGKHFTVPFLESYRGVKLTGNYLGAKEEFQAMHRAWQKYSPEEQAEMLPQLKTELEDRVGNVDALNILSTFLSPEEGESLDRFGGSEAVWDVLDATGVGASVTAAFKMAKSGFNTVKTLRSLKNYEDSETAAAVAVIDPEIGRAMNMDETTAVANALPFDTSIENIGRTGGIANKTLDKLNDFFTEADSVSQSIIRSDGFLREQAVNNKYRVQLEQAARKKFEKEKAENIQIVSKDANTTTFQYQVLDEDGNLTDQKYEMAFDLDSAGTFGQSTMGIIREYIGSPTAFARGMLREDVKTAQRTDFLTARLNKQLSDLTKKALRPIGLIPTPKTRESLAKVDKALREGDEWKNADDTRGKVFNPTELKQQFDLDENEVSAYYRVNRVYNNLWHIRNNEKRAEMETLGYKNVNFARNGDSALGKQYDNALTARAAVTNQTINNIYDAELDEIVDLRSANSDFVAQAYADDKIMIRMDQPYDLGENRGLYRYAMVNKDSVTDLPQQVLHRKEGYVPRIYEDAAYFVKEKRKITVDGDKDYSTTNTLRFFDNKKDAETYKKGLVETNIASKLDELAERNLSPAEYDEAAAKIRKSEEDRFPVLTDREEEQLSAASGEVSHGSNGLYTGARAQDDILFGLEGDRANRVNSYDALTRNIGNLSRYVSINQWRLGMEQRWINSANEIFKSKGIETRIEKFERLPKTSESSPEVRFLNRVFDQIRDWQNFPTPEEQFFSNVMRGMYDWQANKGRKKISRFLGNFRDADPVSAARATAFHSLLGFFNPAQLWVQAQGAATAVSLGFGKYLTRTLSNTGGLTALGYGTVSAERYANVAKAIGQDKGELEAIHKAWQKTGYQDSVLQTADHAAAAKGYGMTMDTIRRVADSGLMFYRQGEFFTRRMAFTTAIERWKEAKGVKSIKGISDNQLKDIIDDSNNILLNMGKANRAAWQKGLPSLPTQFLQVTTKFVETATGLNQNFSRGDRARLLAGQLALYGTAGVPLSGLGYMMATEVFGMTQQDIEENPKMFKAINDGFWGYTALQLFDADIELSDRGSLLRGITSFVDNWFIQESSVAEKFLGAFGSTGQRFFDDIAKRLRPMSFASIKEIGLDDIGTFLVDNPALQSLSSYNNVEKAILMERLDASFSRRGVKVAEGFNFWEVLAQGIGFQSTETAETYDISARVRYLDGLEDKIQADVLNTMNSFAAKYPNGDYPDAALEKHEKTIATYKSMLDPDQQQRLNNAIRRNMLGESTRDRATNRYIRQMIDNTTTDMSIWQQTLLGTKALRTGVKLEEE